MNYKINITSFIKANIYAIIILIVYSFIIIVLPPIDISDIVIAIITLVPMLLILAVVVPLLILIYQHLKYFQISITFQDAGSLILQSNPNNIKVYLDKSNIIQVIFVTSIIRGTLGDGFGYSYTVLRTKEKDYIIPSYIMNRKLSISHFSEYENIRYSWPLIPFIRKGNFNNIAKPYKFRLDLVTDEKIKVSSIDFNLVRILVILSFIPLSIPPFFTIQMYFHIWLILCVVLSMILFLHKSVFITKNQILLKSIWKVTPYHHSELVVLSEIKAPKVIRNLEYLQTFTMIKVVFNDKRGRSKSYLFFPRKGAFKELSRVLDIDRIKK